MVVMDKAVKMPTNLAIEINSTGLSPSKFIMIANNFFKLIDEISSSVSDDGDDLQWNVIVKEGSTILAADHRAAPNIAPYLVVAEKIKHGLVSLQTSNTMPDGFSEAAAKAVKNLASAVGADENDDTAISIWVDDSPTQITHHIFANVTDMFRATYEDYGSIEGRVNLISDKSKLKCDVHDDLYGRDIHCVAKDEHLEVFIKAFRKRVEVSGMIRYRRDGTPDSIVVEKIEIFPDEDDLPGFDDVRGILRGFL